MHAFIAKDSIPEDKKLTFCAVVSHHENEFQCCSRTNSYVSDIKQNCSRFTHTFFLSLVEWVSNSLLILIFLDDVM